MSDEIQYPNIVKVGSYKVKTDDGETEMWRTRNWEGQVAPDQSQINYVRDYLQEEEERLAKMMRQELRILRPDFGLARLIDWDKTAMDTVEGRE